MVFVMCVVLRPPKLIEKQIVRHHISGVGAGDVARANATKDIQLLTGAVNDKVRSFEDKLLKDGFLSKADNEELKKLLSSNNLNFVALSEIDPNNEIT